MKDYQKPEFEVITLVAQENVTTLTLNGDYVEGEMGLESSIFG